MKEHKHFKIGFLSRSLQFDGLFGSDMKSQVFSVCRMDIKLVSNVVGPVSKVVRPVYKSEAKYADRFTSFEKFWVFACDNKAFKCIPILRAVI